MNYVDYIVSIAYHLLFFVFRLFSDTMWSIVQVTESGTLALTQQLSELRTNNTADIPMPKPALEVNIKQNRTPFEIHPIPDLTQFN